MASSASTNNDGESGGAVDKGPIRDQYDDPNIKNDEVLKPLTGVPNPYAPQQGIHLYHASGSFFSQEARLILAEKGVYDDTELHSVCIVSGVYDQYDPDYVRINPRCVVPTLVVDGKVTTDAHNMIQYVEDTELGGPNAPRLIPDDPEEKKCVDEYFGLAGSVFIESLTFGEHPRMPPLPFPMNMIGKGHHETKRQALLECIEKYGDDPQLKASYETKLRLMDGMLNVLDSDDTIGKVIDQTIPTFAKLNRQLTEGPAKDGVSWLCGKDYSKADLLWGLTIYRMQFRGLKDLFWPNYPAIDAYAERIYARPAFQQAVTSWTMPVVVWDILKSKIRKTFGFNFPGKCNE